MRTHDHIFLCGRKPGTHGKTLRRFQPISEPSTIPCVTVMDNSITRPLTDFLIKTRRKVAIGCAPEFVFGRKFSRAPLVTELKQTARFGRIQKQKALS